jgi:hypothetical protein
LKAYVQRRPRLNQSCAVEEEVVILWWWVPRLKYSSSFEAPSFGRDIGIVEADKSRMGVFCSFGEVLVRNGGVASILVFLGVGVEGRRLIYGKGGRVRAGGLKGG